MPKTNTLRSARSRTWALMLLAAAVGAALASALLWFMLDRDGGPAGRSDQDSVARLEALKDVNTSDASPPRQQVLTSQAAGQTVSRPRVNADEISLTPAQAAARKKAMDTEFRRKPADPSLAQLELDMLDGMMSPMLLSAGAIPGNPDIECRRGACKVTATFRSEAEATDWATLYLTTMGAKYGSRAQQAIVPLPDGSIRASLYIAE